MKISILFRIARQVEGEYIFCNVIQASRDENKIRKYLAETALPSTEVLNDIPCILEYGVINNIDIEDEIV